jgi:hypothetical protein
MLTYQVRVDFGAEYGGEIGVALYKGKTAEDALMAYLTSVLNAATDPKLGGTPLPVKILRSNGSAIAHHAGRVYRAVPYEGAGRRY